MSKLDNIKKSFLDDLSSLDLGRYWEIVIVDTEYL